MAFKVLNTFPSGVMEEILMSVSLKEKKEEFKSLLNFLR